MHYKFPRPNLKAPRRVTVDPPNFSDVVRTEHLVPLKELNETLQPHLTKPDVFLIESRMYDEDDPLRYHGLYLGPSISQYLPEVVVDKEGAYVLIFHSLEP